MKGTTKTHAQPNTKAAKPKTRNTETTKPETHRYLRRGYKPIPETQTQPTEAPETQRQRRPETQRQRRLETRRQRSLEHGDDEDLRCRQSCVENAAKADKHKAIIIKHEIL